DIVMHDPAYDPFQPVDQYCDWVCTEWGYVNDLYQCTYYDYQCYTSTAYVASTDYRGNVTSVTTYPDATTTTGAITHSTTYDIAGNVTSADVDCCQKKTISYITGDHYAYPSSVTSGDPSGLHLTESATYDFNTGLVA